MRLRGFALLVLGLVCVSARAEIRLPHVLGDHAVLQRGKPIRVWGWAGAGERVSVTFHGQTGSVVADAAGLWELWLKPETAGGPFVLRVVGDKTAAAVERTDLLVGDVWLASGQSNMEFPLKGFTGAPLKDQEKEIAAANQPRIRLLRQTRRPAGVPLADTDDVWTTCTPETAKDFSAVAYFFGREIAGKEKIPVGLIDTTWGGTPAAAWISGDGIAYSNLTNVMVEGAKVIRDQGRADELRAAYAAQDAALKAAGQPVVAHGRIPGDRNGSWTPSALYNGMIAPYTKYAIKGAIWYQGESDASADRAPYYERVFGGMIKDWRRQWGVGQFPFLFVQISSYGNGADWGTLRDMQRRTLELADTGMAVSLDVGLTGNIHPPDKQTVGGRLAQTALGMVYGQKVEWASPMFVEAAPEAGAMRVWFSHAEGLTTKGQPLGGFEVAGDDKKYVAAEGRIEGNTVVVSSPSVPSPKYVRYAWTGTVNSYFYNAGGLPAGSFTSE